MELNPSVVDSIITEEYTEGPDGVLRPPSYKRPISKWLDVLRELVDLYREKLGFTVHEACQYAAIRTEHSYEFIRGHYGDNPGFGKYVPIQKYLEILKKTDHYPVSDEDMIRAIQAIASRSHCYTTHEVCQYMAIKIQRSYEFVRDALDVENS